MNCENTFCIYQAYGSCTLEIININNLGMCEECIYPEIEKDILEQAKINLLEKYEKADLDVD